MTTRMAVVRLEPRGDEPAIIMIELAFGDDQTLTISTDKTQEHPASDHVMGIARQLIDAVLEEVN